MATKQFKVCVNNLRLGMFVSKLDRPWTHTPFSIQGFYIREPDDIRLLKIHCEYVFIDVLKGPKPLELKQHALSTSTSIHKKTEQRRKKLRLTPIKANPKQYSIRRPARSEIKKADKLYLQVYRSVAQTLREVQHSGCFSAKETVKAASAMVDSVIRNPDAFIWLTRMQSKDEHTFSHSVRASVWAILYGRHLGLPKTDLNVLATAVLLKDVGITRLPDDIVQNLNDSPGNRQRFNQFVEFGVEILENTSGISKRVIEVVKTHQERINGTGFPQGLKGDKIPLLGKIAGIVTYYDSATVPRTGKALSSSQAISKLYEYRDIEFQEDLVVEFIQAIGIYPTGTLVELNNGETAIITEQNVKRRLQPKVLILTDEFKTPLFEPVVIDLSTQESADQSGALKIARDLSNNSISLNLDRIRNDYVKKYQQPSILGRAINKLIPN